MISVTETAQAENIEVRNKPKVLIVEDEKGLRLGTKRLLQGEGYNVTAAETGNEGVSLGTASEFDLAVIDLRMPDLDGIEVMKEIVKIFPNTVCFIVTAYASYDTAIEAAKVGAYSYIPKPFNPPELLDQLRKGYERRTLLLEAEKWRKEREERLLEITFEKTRLNTVINSITDGVLVVNKNGEVVLYNPSAMRYLNLEKISIEEYIIDKLHPSISDLINKFLGTNNFERKSYSTQIEIKNASGQKGPGDALFIEATSSPVPHPDGTLAGVVVTIKNITEMKKIEMLKSQFVSMVSHELKAPVAAVYGYLKLLSDGSLNISREQQANYIIRSQIRLDGLLKMVNDLLDISRMEMKTVQRELKDLNLLEIIKGVIDLLHFETSKKNIEVEINKAENVPSFRADSDEMIRLFTNLISNAVKYNKDNGKINIDINDENKFIVIKISDTGIGLKPAEKEKLFQEFFRAKNEKTKNISGTGLGLSIVKRIVDSYSGKIEAESEYGTGTCFKVSLPH
ncbi:MAG TPA: response regulator [Ignavibacteriaceae bacterium]|nr:response regulator [Ignavibacteriaceae bacterium]